MASLTLDELVVIINAQTKDFKRQVAEVNDQLEGISRTAKKASDPINKMGADLMKVGKGMAIGVAIAGIALLTKNIGGAVRRVDTLNNAPKVLQNLGYSAEDSAKAISTIAEGLDGLPSKLDDTANALVAIASASGLGIEEATDLTLAFNNMALAGGKGAEDANRALIQFTQSLGRGKMGAQEFNTLMEVMPAQLSQVAKTLLGPTANAATLKDAFSDGRVTMDQFTEAIVSLDKTGGEGFASFEQQARDATKGIGTAWQNLNARIQNGLAQIINAIGASGISDKINAISTSIKNGLSAIAGWIEANPRLASTIALVAAASAVLLTAVGAIGLILPSIIAGFKLLAAVIALVTSPVSLVVIGIAALVAGIVYLWNTSEGFRNFFIGMWNSIVSALQPVINVFNNQLLPVLKTIWSFVANQFRQAWESLKQAFISIRNTLQPYIDQMRGPLMTVLKAVGIAIAVAFIAPLALLVGGIVAVVTVIAVVISAIARFIGWLANLYSKLLQVANLVSGTVVSYFRNAWNTISGIWGRAAGFFSGIGNAVGNAFSSVPGKFRGVFQSAWNQITSIFSRLSSWFSNIDLSGAGRKMIQSLINGINGMVGAAKNAAGRVVQEIRDFFPFSPAKEGPFSGSGYTTHSGKALMRDFADAIQKQSPYLKKTMTDAMPELAVPSLNQLENKIESSAPTARLGNIEERSNHIVVKIGEDTLIDRVVKGINRQSFMGNATVIEI
jgi:tape measure domain-containing protein